MARWVKGQSGNPTGRPRRDPLADPVTWEAIERCLHWPLSKQPVSRAELLACRVIKKATSGGSMKPIDSALQRLAEHRKLKANRVTRPWDAFSGDDSGETGETGPDQVSDPQNALTASIEQNIHLDDAPAQNTQQGAELDAMARLAAIQAKASPVPRFAVFGQPPKPAPIPVDERFDPLKGLDGQTIWAITHEPGYLSRPLPEQEPVRSAPSSIPYRIGG